MATDGFSGLQHQKQTRQLKKYTEVTWDSWQRNLACVVRSSIFEGALTCTVVLSFILVVLEADFGSDVPMWLTSVNNVLVVFYTVEMLLRIFIYRWFFFTVPLNIFELLVVVIEVGFHIYLLVADGNTSMPSVAPLRVIRLLRLARGYGFLLKFPQLALMVKGLLSAASAALYGTLLVLVILSIWAVFAVYLLDPIAKRESLQARFAGCERCPYAFSSVRSSMLTFIQQIIAGDSWGQVSIPIIEEEPMTVFFFGMVFVSVNFTIMNVMLAVIVDSALKNSQEDVEELLRHKQAVSEQSKVYLLEICKEMDTNGSGDLGESELIEGFDSHEDFRHTLQSMDIQKNDLSLVFKILDADGSGSVEYEEFMSELFKMKEHDSHTMLCFIKHYAIEIHKDVREQLNLFKTSITQVLQNVLEGKDTAGSITRFLGDDVEAKDTHQSCTSTMGSWGVIEEDVSRHISLSTAVDSAAGSVRNKNLQEELGAEFRRLREVVSEELLASMREISQRLDLDTKLDPRAQRSKQAKQETRPAQSKQYVRGKDSVAPDSVVCSPRRDHCVRLPSSTWGMKTRCDSFRPGHWESQPGHTHANTQKVDTLAQLPANARTRGAPPV